MIENLFLNMSFIIVCIDLAIGLGLLASGRILQIKCKLKENEYQDIEYMRTKSSYDLNGKISETSYSKKFRVENTATTFNKQRMNVSYYDEANENYQNSFKFDVFNNGMWSLKKLVLTPSRNTKFI